MAAMGAGQVIELAVFDLETTGVDPNSDRIVTAFFGVLDGDGELTVSREWIVDPGVPIPPGASNVHGWTAERLAADPRTRHDLDVVAVEIVHAIWAACNPARPDWMPVAGHNLAYDLTMLRAHLHEPDAQMVPFGPSGVRVLDSYVLDKHFDPRVPGSGQRKLTPTAARYGIELTDAQAHDAAFDAVAAGRICQRILSRWTPPESWTAQDAVTWIHGAQVRWRREQQASLERWLRANVDPEIVCERGWPIA